MRGGGLEKWAHVYGVASLIHVTSCPEEKEKNRSSSVQHLAQSALEQALNVQVH